LNHSLTENIPPYKMMAIPQEEVDAMKGKIYSHRKGFRVYWPWKGETFWFYQDQFGKPFKHEFYALEFLHYLNKLGDKFDPSEWRKDTPYNFKKAIEVYLELGPGGPEWKHQKENISKRYLIPFFETEDIREIKKIHIDRFHARLKDKKLSDKSIKNIMMVLQGFLNFNREVLPKVPTFPKINPQEVEIRALTAEEQDKVFACIPEKHLPVFTFLRFTGCRPNEAGGLLRENVRLREENPFVVISTTIGPHGEIRKRTKTRSIRILPIIPEIKDALKPREATKLAFSQGGRPYSIWRLERIWNTACKKAGIKINLYNGLKHSFGCQRIEQGFNKVDLKEVFGHRDMRSVDRYAKYQIGRVGEIMRGRPCADLVQEKKEVSNYAK